MTRRKQILQALKDAGSQGLTVIEAMQQGLGTEMRKICSTLIREGEPIDKKWQTKAGKRFIRYYYIKPEKQTHFKFEGSVAIECDCERGVSHS